MASQTTKIIIVSSLMHNSCATSRKSHGQENYRNCHTCAPRVDEPDDIEEVSRVFFL